MFKTTVYLSTSSSARRSTRSGCSPVAWGAGAVRFCMTRMTWSSPPTSCSTPVSEANPTEARASRPKCDAPCASRGELGNELYQRIRQCLRVGRRRLGLHHPRIQPLSRREPKPVRVPRPRLHPPFRRRPTSPAKKITQRDLYRPCRKAQVPKRAHRRTFPSRGMDHRISDGGASRWASARPPSSYPRRIAGRRARGNCRDHGRPIRNAAEIAPSRAERWVPVEETCRGPWQKAGQTLMEARLLSGSSLVLNVHVVPRQSAKRTWIGKRSAPHPNRTQTMDGVKGLLVRQGRGAVDFMSAVLNSVSYAWLVPVSGCCFGCNLVCARSFTAFPLTQATSLSPLFTYQEGQEQTDFHKKPADQFIRDCPPTVL